MADFPNLGDILLHPEPYVHATQAWLQDNSAMLVGVAVGALAVSGAVGFGAAYVAKWMSGKRDERRRWGGLREARQANLLRNPKLKFSGIPIGKIGFKRLTWIDQEVVFGDGRHPVGQGRRRHPARVRHLWRPACRL